MKGDKSVEVIKEISRYIDIFVMPALRSELNDMFQVYRKVLDARIDAHGAFPDRRKGERRKL